MSNDYDSKPLWIDNHPKEFIFDLLENKIRVGSVWYRPLDVGFEIDYIEIEIHLRKKGLGAKLLGEFISFCGSEFKARQNSSEKPLSYEIWLEVSVLNIPAIGLYCKLGFKPIHVRPQYYSDGSDAQVMQLKIKL